MIGKGVGSRCLSHISAVALIASWLIGCIGAGSNTPVTPLAPEQFPSLQGISLLGEQVALPAGFEGDINLVSMGFVRGHQEDINSWIDIIPDLTQAFPELRFYEVPVIYEAGPLFRWWLNNGMRIGVVDEDARRRTITVYTDRDQFSQAVGLSDLDRITTVLLDDEARIVWRQSGPITPEAKQDLMETVQMYHEAQ